MFLSYPQYQKFLHIQQKAQEINVYGLNSIHKSFFPFPFSIDQCDVLTTIMKPKIYSPHTYELEMFYKIFINYESVHLYHMDNLHLQ